MTWEGQGNGRGYQPGRFSGGLAGAARLVYVPGFRITPIKLFGFYSAFSIGSTCEYVKKNIVIFIKVGFLSDAFLSSELVLVRFQISSLSEASSLKEWARDAKQVWNGTQKNQYQPIKYSNQKCRKKTQKEDVANPLRMDIILKIGTESNL